MPSQNGKASSEIHSSCDDNDDDLRRGSNRTHSCNFTYLKQLNNIWRETDDAIRSYELSIWEPDAAEGDV